MVDFVSLTTPRPTGPGVFALDVPDGWQQGRGAFGGFSLAVLVRAIESADDASQRPLRSLTAEFCAPLLPGPAEVFVETLRRGSGMTTVAARIVQEGSVATHAVGILARAREDTPCGVVEAPRLEAWRDVPALPPQEMVRFSRFFEYRNVGPEPLAGGEALVETWLRLRSPPARVDAAYVTALADATWPALLSHLTQPRAVGTVSFMLQLFGPFDAVDPAAPVRHRGRVLSSRDGYSAETRELWTEDGRLLCLNHQTIATIR
jgi:hypothetical protein